MIFLFKKIVPLSLMPLTICIGLLAFGVLLLWFRRRLNPAKIILTCGVIFLTVLSFSMVADEIIKPLEMVYTPLLDAKEIMGVSCVVVLGGGHTTNPEFPATSQIGNASLARLVEGIRIHKLMPGSKLFLSGGAVFDPLPEANTMAEVAHMLGVNKDDMVLETQSKDTEQQAMRIREILGPISMVLVTSAVHMPRAMRVFESAGLHPIPAPVDFSDWMRSETGPQQFFPRAKELKKVESALHEYLGLLWFTLKLNMQ